MIEQLPRVATPRSLAVRHYTRWCADLERAVANLPEMPACPHELFVRLAVNPGAPKRYAIVFDDGAPVAVAALRREQHHWCPVGTGVTPGAVMPSRDGYALPALASLSLDIWVRYVDEPPPPGYAARVMATPRYAATPGVDLERHWRATGMWQIVQRARRKTRGCGLVVDAPGAERRAALRWRERWAAEGSSEVDAFDDLLIAVDYYAKSGRYHTFELVDGATPVAGHSFFIDGCRIISQSMWFDAAHRSRSPGSRLTELVFAWAFDGRYGEVDLGGGHAYKARWAPPAGEVFDFNVCPRPLFRLKQLKRLVAQGMTRIARKASDRGADDE